jgi:hypothetical protein
LSKKEQKEKQSTVGNREHRAEARERVQQTKSMVGVRNKNTTMRRQRTGPREQGTEYSEQRAER